MIHQKTTQGILTSCWLLVAIALLAPAWPAAASDAPQLDSLLRVWHDESASIDERFAAFDKLYAGYHQRYPDTMLVELEELAVKALEHNRPLLLYDAWLRKGGLLNYKWL
ncbi:MAG: hypothetical protein ACPH8E_05645, partial [Flavobacteriales bacterium]